MTIAAHSRICVRPEQASDLDAVDGLLRAAFGQNEEAALVQRLRAGGDARLSLVATLDDAVVGHVLYSPVAAGDGADRVEGVGLAPLAVLPAMQGRGVGTRLVEAGDAHLRDAGSAFVVVLGDPGYYGRFGFEPAARYGLRCRWEVPESAFMVRLLQRRALDDVSGLVSYRPAFDALA